MYIHFEHFKALLTFLFMFIRQKVTQLILSQCSISIDPENESCSNIFRGYRNGTII